MSSFTNHTKIQPCGDQWINLESFRFYHDDSKTGKYDTIPAGMKFDGCSIPLCILGPRVEPKTITACCYHDYLVGIKKYGYWKTNILFLNALRVSGVYRIKRIRYFVGVTIGCWWGYYKIKEKLGIK